MTLLQPSNRSHEREAAADLWVQHVGARRPTSDGEHHDVDDILALMERPEWHSRAACRGMAFESEPKFFPERGAKVTPAMEVCATCPVQEQCLAAAMAGSGERHGIWGGTSERQRRSMRRARWDGLSEGERHQVRSARQARRQVRMMAQLVSA